MYNENKNSRYTSFKGHMSEFVNLEHFQFKKFSEKIIFPHVVCYTDLKG